MYIRYTQPPTDWFEPFLDDEEDLDVKAGGGWVKTIGEMLRSFSQNWSDFLRCF